MKKVKLVGLLALSGLAVSVLLTSCNKDSVNMKNLYGLDDDVIENYIEILRKSFKNSRKPI